MIIDRIVKLLKGIKTPGKIDSKSWWMVVAQGAFIKVEAVLIVIGEVGNLLEKRQLMSFSQRCQANLWPSYRSAWTGFVGELLERLDMELAHDGYCSARLHIAHRLHISSRWRNNVPMTDKSR